MNNRRIVRILRIFSVTLLLVSAGFPALADSHQPRMEQALEYLEQAKTAAEQIPLLEKAKAELEKAKRNKGGRRLDAIEAIDQAIELVKKGENPESKIVHAMAMVRSGISRGKN